MGLDIHDVRVIVQDELSSIQSDLSEIKNSLDDMASALGWLIKRAKDADQKALEVVAHDTP